MYTRKRAFISLGKYRCVIDLDLFFLVQYRESTQPIRLPKGVALPVQRVGVCITEKTIHTLQCIYNATTKMHRISDIVCATKKQEKKRREKK
jgi:hypothetical protein